MWAVRSSQWPTGQTFIALLRIKDLPRVPEIYRNYRITCSRRLRRRESRRSLRSCLVPSPCAGTLIRPPAVNREHSSYTKKFIFFSSGFCACWQTLPNGKKEKFFTVRPFCSLQVALTWVSSRGARNKSCTKHLLRFDSPFEEGSCKRVVAPSPRRCDLETMTFSLVPSQSRVGVTLSPVRCGFG